MEVSIASVVCQNTQLLSSEMDGEVVMMDIESGKYYGMNKMGSQIWRLIETPTTVIALCDTLEQIFDINRTVCEQEVIHFLSDMHKEELVSVKDN